MRQSLICSVGGSSEPIIYSILSQNPKEVYFIVSQLSVQLIDHIVKSTNIKTYKLFLLNDEQNLSSCVQELSNYILNDKQIMSLLHTEDLIVDITGGTKIMVASIAIVFSAYPITFSYVGGVSRDKMGLGTVFDGTEKIIFCKNPLDINKS